MKKILFGIFSIILGFVGFLYGDYFSFYLNNSTTYNREIVSGYSTFSLTGSTCIMSTQACMRNLQLYNNTGFNIFQNQSYLNSNNYSHYRMCFTESVLLYSNNNSNCTFYYTTPEIISDSSCSSCEDKNITVFYNSGNTESILCDGTQAIEIKGLSTLTSTNTFTPYFNISYKDEDNQSLVESYSKDILYLNGLFKKTYTGDNERILTSQGGGSESDFIGYLPTFEITGGIEEVSESGNIFNNFAENSVKFTLSNIPSYIQYVILLFILFFILGFIRKFRRK